MLVHAFKRLHEMCIPVQ